MIRRAILAAALVVGAACLNTTEPRGFIFRYQLSAFNCATTCDTVGAATLDSASQGDTVWLEHLISLIGAVDSFTVQHATLRPDCAGHIAILLGNAAVQRIPVPTCPDSTYQGDFTLVGTPIPNTLAVYTRWVVDSTLVPGVYTVQGRVMVQPRVEPSFGFTIQ